MSLNRQHSFWGSLSPLGGLTAVGLLIMASARLSWSITIAGSLFWVYGLTAFTYNFLLSVIGNKFFPAAGRITLYTCLSSLFGSIYLLLFWLICPFAALEVLILLLLVPLFCASTAVGTIITDQKKIEQNTPQSSDPQLFEEAAREEAEAAPAIDIFEHVSDAVSQAATIAGLLIAFSIIREPLAYCSLSFPGTFHGMVTIMYFRANDFFPISIFASSSGALLLLGYFICLYQYGKEKLFPGENK